MTGIRIGNYKVKSKKHFPVELFDCDVIEPINTLLWLGYE